MRQFVEALRPCHRSTGRRRYPAKIVVHVYCPTASPASAKFGAAFNAPLMTIWYLRHYIGVERRSMDPCRSGAGQ